MKDYKFQCVLYEESQKDIIENLKNNYNCAYILHDKDVDLQNNKIKPHYHFVVKLDKETRFTTLSKELNLPINVIEKLPNLNLGLLYLIHKTPNSSLKYQYSIDSVGGSLKSELIRILSYDKNQQESLAILQIIEYIEKNPNIKFKEIVKECCKMGLYSHLRRGASIFRQIYFECVDLPDFNCYNTNK